MIGPNGINGKRLLRVCAYEDRPEAMDSAVLMGESLCRTDPNVSLHLTLPNAPASVRAWAERRPEVVLTTTSPEGVSGWDVKPWLLLQELQAGYEAALWLDADLVVTRPISVLLAELQGDVLLVAEEWNRQEPTPVAHWWGFTAARAIRPVNSCLVRVTQRHRPLLERWLELTRDPRYRAAQALPLARRPWHLASDQVLLTALLASSDFGAVPFKYVLMGRHLVHCAGSSGYRPTDRLLDLGRGLPTLIHCIGRKPWEARLSQGRVARFLVDLATDLSPYVLAARRVARDLGMSPEWVHARTALGAVSRALSGQHPGLAGLPLAMPHGAYSKFRDVAGLGAHEGPRMNTPVDSLSPGRGVEPVH